MTTCIAKWQVPGTWHGGKRHFIPGTHNRTIKRQHVHDSVIIQTTSYITGSGQHTRNTGQTICLDAVNALNYSNAEWRNALLMDGCMNWLRTIITTHYNMERDTTTKQDNLHCKMTGTVPGVEARDTLYQAHIIAPSNSSMSRQRHHPNYLLEVVDTLEIQDKQFVWMLWMLWTVLMLDEIMH